MQSQGIQGRDDRCTDRWWGGVSPVDGYAMQPDKLAWPFRGSGCLPLGDVEGCLREEEPVYDPALTCGHSISRPALLGVPQYWGMDCKHTNLKIKKD